MQHPRFWESRQRGDHHHPCPLFLSPVLLLWFSFSYFLSLPFLFPFLLPVLHYPNTSDSWDSGLRQMSALSSIQLICESAGRTGRSSSPMWLLVQRASWEFFSGLLEHVHSVWPSTKGDTDGHIPRNLDQRTPLLQGTSDSIKPWRKKYLTSQLSISKSRWRDPTSSKVQIKDGF